MAGKRPSRSNTTKKKVVVKKAKKKAETTTTGRVKKAVKVFAEYTCPSDSKKHFKALARENFSEDTLDINCKVCGEVHSITF